MSNLVNFGFYDLPAQDRANAMDAACERGGVGNFFDLSPEERAQCYEQASQNDENIAGALEHNARRLKALRRGEPLP